MNEPTVLETPPKTIETPKPIVPIQENNGLNVERAGLVDTLEAKLAADRDGRSVLNDLAKLSDPLLSAFAKEEPESQYKNVTELKTIGEKANADKAQLKEELKKDILAKLPLTDYARERLLYDLNLINEGSTLITSYELNLPAFPGAQISVNVSPTSERMKQFLTTDRNLGEFTQDVYQKALADGADRFIEITINSKDGRFVYGVSTLYLVKNDAGDLIAQAPNNVLRLYRANQIDLLKKLGDNPQTIRGYLSSPGIQLSNTTQFTSDALVIDERFRGKGLGRPLVHMGNLIAQAFGAKERVFFTDATHTSDGQSYYEKYFGAIMKPITTNGKEKVVSVMSLLD